MAEGVNPDALRGRAWQGNRKNGQVRKGERWLKTKGVDGMTGGVVALSGSTEEAVSAEISKTKSKSKKYKCSLRNAAVAEVCGRPYITRIPRNHTRRTNTQRKTNQIDPPFTSLAQPIGDILLLFGLSLARIARKYRIHGTSRCPESC